MQGCFFFLFILNYFSSVDTNDDLKGVSIDRYPCEKHMSIFFYGYSMQFNIQE